MTEPTDAHESPKSLTSKALTAVPVALTALATVLAGLSSSEMSRSMYYRSLAAQNQAKAGSQWAFFQAKRMRGTTLESASDLVRVLAAPKPFNPDLAVGAVSSAENSLRALAEGTNTEPAIRESAASAAERVKAESQKLNKFVNLDRMDMGLDMGLGVLAAPSLPAIEEHRSKDATLQELVQAVKSRQTETQTAALVARVDPARLDEAIALADANAAAFDQACQPIIDKHREVESLFGQIADEVRIMQARLGNQPDSPRTLDNAADALKESLTGMRIARQDFNARRYTKEAAYNQESAELYEILVRRNGFESDRHRDRSRNFFYAMLCAQAGVTVASLALARSRMSFFWAVAGIAGSVALVFGAYAYLAM